MSTGATGHCGDQIEPKTRELLHVEIFDLEEIAAKVDQRRRELLDEFKRKMDELASAARRLCRPLCF